MSKTRSFITAGAILGGTVIVTAGSRAPVPAEPEYQAPDIRPGGGNHRTYHELQVCGLP